MNIYLSRQFRRFIVLVGVCTLGQAASVSLAADFSWMDGMSAADSDRVASSFKARDKESGALWEWKSTAMDGAGGEAFFSVHPPWRKQKGVVFADFPVALPSAARTLAFTGDAVVASKGGDGVGVSVLVNDAAGDDGTWHFVKSLHVAPGGEVHSIDADLSKWAGCTVKIRVQVDPKKSPSADTTRLSRLRVLADGAEIAGMDKLRDVAQTAWFSSSALANLELRKMRPKDASIMTRHLEGRQVGVNVYSRQDSYRPMIGAHIYLTPEAHRYVPYLNDLFDFAAHGGGGKGNSLMEENGIPWIQVIQNAIPLGAWDAKRQERLANTGRQLPGYKERFRFSLGVTSGSEPHINPTSATLATRRKKWRPFPEAPRRRRAILARGWPGFMETSRPRRIPTGMASHSGPISDFPPDRGTSWGSPCRRPAARRSIF